MFSIHRNQTSSRGSHLFDKYDDMDLTVRCQSSISNTWDDVTDILQVSRIHKLLLKVLYNVYWLPKGGVCHYGEVSIFKIVVLQINLSNKDVDRECSGTTPFWNNSIVDRPDIFDLFPNQCFWNHNIVWFGIFLSWDD